jgi:heat shock protein HtpX
VSDQHEERRQEDNTPTFPWHDLQQWLTHLPAKLWQGVKSACRRLKEIPPHRRKTYLAMAGMVCLLLIGGVVLGIVLGSIGAGILFVVSVTAVWLAVIYFKGNSILPLLSGAQPVKEDEYPQLVDMVKQLAETAELPTPAFWIAENADVNAFACGRDAEHAAIVVYTGGLDIWKGEEIRGILAHEMAHIKNRDILLNTFMFAILNGLQWSAVLFMKPFYWMMRLFALFVSKDGQGALNGPAAFMVLCLSWFLRALDFLFGVILLPLTQLTQRAASRQQEYYADATGIQLAGNSEGLVAALGKINILEQASSGWTAAFSAQGAVKQLWSTHPPTVKRIEKLGGTPSVALDEETSDAAFDQATQLTFQDYEKDEHLEERLALWERALQGTLSDERRVQAHLYSLGCYVYMEDWRGASREAAAALRIDAARQVGYFSDESNRQTYFPPIGSALTFTSDRINEARGSRAAIAFLEEHLALLDYLPGEHMPAVHLSLGVLYGRSEKKKKARASFERVLQAERHHEMEDKAVQLAHDNIGLLNK